MEMNREAEKDIQRVKKKIHQGTSTSSTGLVQK